MVTALAHLRRRVLKRKNARFQCREYKHRFSWTLRRLSMPTQLLSPKELKRVLLQELLDSAPGDIRITASSDVDAGETLTKGTRRTTRIPKLNL